MKETAKEIDLIVEEWLAKHRRKRGNKCVGEEDFMDIMLSICGDKKNLHGFDADDVIKSTCMALQLQTAGSDTTIVTLIWALSLLQTTTMH